MEVVSLRNGEDEMEHGNDGSDGSEWGCEDLSHVTSAAAREVAEQFLEKFPGSEIVGVFNTEVIIGMEYEGEDISITIGRTQ